MRRPLAAVVIATALGLTGSWTARASIMTAPEHTLTVACPAHEPGHTCYLSVRSVRSAPELLLAATAATSSATFTTRVAYYDCVVACLLYTTTTLRNQDWWNGRSAGTYWASGSCAVFMLSWWCNPGSWGHFWNGGSWATNSWQNARFGWNLGPVGMTASLYLRSYTQPNGHHWQWWSCEAC